MVLVRTVAWASLNWTFPARPRCLAMVVTISTARNLHCLASFPTLSHLVLQIQIVFINKFFEKLWPGSLNELAGSGNKLTLAETYCEWIVGVDTWGRGMRGRTSSSPQQWGGCLCCWCRSYTWLGRGPDWKTLWGWPQSNWAWNQSFHRFVAMWRGNRAGPSNPGDTRRSTPCGRANCRPKWPRRLISWA